MQKNAENNTFTASPCASWITVTAAKILNAEPSNCEARQMATAEEENSNASLNRRLRTRKEKTLRTISTATGDFGLLSGQRTFKAVYSD